MAAVTSKPNLVPFQAIKFLPYQFFEITFLFFTKYNFTTMGFLLRGLQRRTDVPTGYPAVYVGDNQKKRFIIPMSFLNHPLFQDFLSQAEQKFGNDHPMGGLTIPCSEDVFLDITSHLHRS